MRCSSPRCYPRKFSKDEFFDHTPSATSELFDRAKHHLRGYTRRGRQHAFDWIQADAMNTWAQQPVRTQRAADAAWRREVESWLQREGVIVLSEPKCFTRFP
jgi:hypothetical protein